LSYPPVNSRPAVWMEGILLTAAAPWLLFPTVVPVATAAALVLLIIAWLASWYSTRQPFPVTPFNSALLLWCLALAVGIGVTADPDLTLPKATGLILGIAVWRLLVTAVQDRRTLTAAVWLYVAIGVSLILPGVLSAQWRFKVPLVQMLLGQLPPRLLQLPEGPDAGVSLNQIAGTILLYWPLLITAVASWRPSGYRKAGLFVIAAVLLVLTGLLLVSQSRSAWIGAAAGALVLLLLAVNLQSWLRRRRQIGMALFMLLLGAVLLLSPRLATDPLPDAWLQPPAIENATGNLSTVAFRLEVWQWAVVGIQDFPFTGTGLGTFRRVVFRFYPIAVNPNYDIAHAHNIFLQVALDVGLPGLIAYLAFVGLTLYAAWQIARRDPGLRPLALSLLAGLIALHVYGVSDALAPGSKPALAFWFAAGLVAAMLTMDSNRLRAANGTAAKQSLPGPDNDHDPGRVRTQNN
jgi:putative inorganic carbon (hco3(-)) transporter